MRGQQSVAEPQVEEAERKLREPERLQHQIKDEQSQCSMSDWKCVAVAARNVLYSYFTHLFSPSLGYHLMLKTLGLTVVRLECHNKSDKYQAAALRLDTKQSI